MFPIRDLTRDTGSGKEIHQEGLNYFLIRIPEYPSGQSYRFSRLIIGFFMARCLTGQKKNIFDSLDTTVMFFSFLRTFDHSTGAGVWRSPEHDKPWDEAEYGTFQGESREPERVLVP